MAAIPGTAIIPGSGGTGVAKRNANPTIRGEPKNQSPFTRPVGKKPVTTQTSVATGTHKPAPPLSDADQISAWVKAAQLPQIQAINDARAAADAQSAKNAETVKGYYLALAGLMGNVGSRVQSGYQQAAGATDSFGKGFSDGLDHINSQMGAEGQNALGLAGAPPSQQAAPTAAAGAGASDALYATGGYIPASTLAREGAAYGAAADFLPASTGYEGAMQLKQLMDAQGVTDKGFSTQLTDLAAQVPGLSLQYGQALDAKHAATAAAAAATARDVFTRNMAIDKYNLSLKEDRIKQSNVNRQFAAQRYALNGMTPANRARIAAETGVDPVTQQYTIAGRTKYASTYGYDPVTGQQTYAARHAVDVGNAAIDKFNAKQRSDAAKISPTLSAQAGHWVHNDGSPYHNPDGSLHPVKATGATAGGTSAKPLTHGQVLSFVKGLAKTQRVPDLDASGNTQLDANNKVKYKTDTQFRMPYQQAYTSLRQSGMTDKAARTALNAVYPKGLGGRDWLTNEQQAALKRAKQPIGFGIISDIKDANGDPLGDRAYITLAQRKALKARGILPAGFWHAPDQPGPAVWVLKPGY